MGNKGSIVSFFCCFKAEAVALASTPDHFLEDAPPRVFTILRFTKKKTKKQKGVFAFERQEIRKVK